MKKIFWTWRRVSNSLQDNQISIGGSDDVICGQKVTISNVKGEDADLLVDALLGEGAQAATIEEYRQLGNEEQKIYCQGLEDRKVWNSCSVIAWLPQDQQNIDEFMKYCISVSGVNNQDYKFSIEQIFQSNFEEQVKSEYQPIKVEEGLWIVPAWCKIVETDALNIILRPGLAFGTGTHPTTKLCLQWLNQNKNIFQNKDFLDYGTGSGVLAICAKLKGANRCVGIDIDPMSIVAAKQNVQENGFLEEKNGFFWYQCEQGFDVETDPLVQNDCEVQKFDVVVANILLGPLIDLAPRLCNYLKPGGWIVLQGILHTQVQDVEKVYQQYIGQFDCYQEGEWVLLAGIAKIQS